MMRILIVSILVLIRVFANAQQGVDDEQNKCGIPLASDSAFTYKSKGTGWGYTYDSLLVDFKKWNKSAYVKVDSIGASTQNRAIWKIQITDNFISKSVKIHIAIHARTHPGEVQAERVVNEIIQILLDTTTLAKLLRGNFVFTIIPMINPDGVELGNARENANMIDIESNWSNASPEKEVQVLKNFYTQLMNSAMPINIALNMHSAYDCKRFFVVHDANGTNANYFESEKKFVTAIRNYFPDGIQNWDYNITWKTSTPTYYPESFFWLNYADNVMALTYEDMNCTTAGSYTKTASAFLNGIADYTGLKSYNAIEEISANNCFIIFPNPAKESLTVVVSTPLNNQGSAVTERSRSDQREIQITNTLGQTIFNQQINSLANQHIDVSTFPTGLYQVVWNNSAVKLMIVR